MLLQINALRDSTSLKVEIVNNPNLFDLITNLITPIAATIGVIIAFLGLLAWKKQMKAKNLYDVSHRVLRLIYGIRDCIFILRPITKFKNHWGDVFLYGLREINDSDLSKMKSKEYIGKTIYGQTYEQFLKLDSEIKTENLEIEIHFEKKVNILLENFISLVADFFTNYNMYLAETIMLSRKGEEKKDRNIYLEKYVFRNEDNSDEFSVELNKSILLLEKILKPIIKLKV